MRIAVCAPQVPFVRGGAEIFAETLVDELRARDHETELVTVPFKWYPGTRVLDQAFLWLDRAIENREWWMFPFLRSDRFYSSIRGDARFQRAMRRLEAIEAMGSPTRSVATRSGVSE